SRSWCWSWCSNQPVCSGVWRRPNREANVMTNGVTATLARPFEHIPDAWRQPLGLTLLIAAAVLFPLVHTNDADIDSMANAAAYAVLALGLNIVVGFAGLLDLGYAAFFAIGAYFYGVLSSFQLWVASAGVSSCRAGSWCVCWGGRPGPRGRDRHLDVSPWVHRPSAPAAG